MAEAQEVAERIRSSETWNDQDARELRRLAGMEQDYQNADGDTFEAIIYAAADVLHVAI